MLRFIKNIFRPFYTGFKFPQANIAFTARISLDSVLGKDVRILEKCNIGNCNIGDYCYIGSGSEMTRTYIGRFSSVGGEVLCGLGLHPLNFVSTYPGFYSKHASGSTWFGVSHEVVENEPVHIGADVWIGTRAIILGGIKIGHGAVVAAGAIVTKDVPDYAIVAGVPAKIIRYRFDEKMIERLLDSTWWEMADSDLKEMAKYINDPEEFLKKLDSAKNAK